jgi:dipeptidyl aminopeptidase/acylaminoacyl peptidase
MRPRIRGTLSFAFALSISTLCPTGQAAAQSLRPLTPEDVVNFWSIGSSTLSPDGEWLAVEVRRPPTSPSRFRGPSLRGERSDVWLVSARTGETRNLTDGQRDSTGAFSPLWSPDGDRLAFLSTRGRDDRIHIFVWERQRDRTRSPSSQGVLDRAAFVVGPNSSNGLAWLDDQSLLFVSPPRGYGLTTMDIAPEEWRKARLGEEPTVSVLESGSAITPRERPKSRLMHLDVVSGESTDLAEVPPEDPLQSVTVTAPALGSGVLIIQADLGPHAPPPAHPLLSSTSRLTRIAVISSEEPSAPEWIEDVPGAGSRVEWLPDGSAAIAPGRVSDDEDEARLFLVSPGAEAVRTLETDSLEITSARWTPDGDLLVFAQPRSADEAEGPTAAPGGETPQEEPDSLAADSIKRANRSNWWLLSRDLTNARNLTAGLEEVPRSLLPVLDGATFVGLADSTLWLVNTRSATASPVSTSSDSKFTSIVWPSRSGARPPLSPVVIAQAGEGADRRLYRLDLGATEAEVREFPQPTPRAGLQVFDPERSLAVYQGTERTGTYLWLGDGESPRFDTAISLNTALADIADARRMLIEYRGVEGDSLKGVLLLPPGYEEGKRYPLVTWVYAGSVFRDTLSFSFEKSSGSSLNPQLFTAHGYAVLFPSMPLEGDGVASDPYIDLPKGVLAAVDKVIDLGIADPERLAVAGHSYGGYSTYTLVSYTNRFQAAIAMDGDANLLTSYAKFDADQRYWDNAQERREGATWSETSQGRMGEPPWSALWRYLRNSPFFYLDRIETPLMIIQSDMDFVPVIHGEEMFAGLYRLGKTARFVRYWGEGHSPASPANIRDMWQRIYEWLDEYLAQPQKEEKE